MKLRVKEMLVAGEGLSSSPIVLAAALALVTLFGWSLAVAAETSDKTERAIRTAQLQRIVSDDPTPARPAHGASEREKALFWAPPAMMPQRSASSLPEDLYDNQGRLGSQAE